MPRLSLKQRYLRSLYQLFNRRLIWRARRTLEDDDDSVEDATDLCLATAIRNAKNRRYLFRKSKYRRGIDRFAADLDGGDDNNANDEDNLTEDSIEEEAERMPWLTDEEFLQKYRMSRESFSKVVDKIKNHRIFNRGKRGRKQAPVAHQLMVFLKYVGTEGSGASNANQRHTFSIGYGTSAKYRQRVTRALLSLRDNYISHQIRSVWVMQKILRNGSTCEPLRVMRAMIVTPPKFSDVLKFRCVTKYFVLFT